MSSSTSTSSGGARRRLLAVLVPLAVVLGGVAAVNLAVDPYGRFTRVPRPMPRTNFGAHDLALHSAIELERLPAPDVRQAEVVLAGESRAYPLTGKRVSQARDLRVLNLAIPSASQEEYLDFLGRELPRVAQPRLVIVIVSLERFAEPARPNRIPQARTLLRSPLHYLLNRKVLLDSLARREGAAAPRTAPPKPSAALPVQPDPRIALTWRHFQAYYQPRFSDERIAALRRALEPIRRRGVPVLLWAPPLRPDMVAAMEQYGFVPEWERLCAELRSIAPLVDLTTTQELNGTVFKYSDPTHHINGALILDHLIAAGLTPDH